MGTTEAQVQHGGSTGGPPWPQLLGRVDVQRTMMGQRALVLKTMDSCGVKRSRRSPSAGSRGAGPRPWN